MDSWKTDIKCGLEDFIVVAKLDAFLLDLNDITVEFHPCPHHQSPKLPQVKMEIYAF